MNFEQMNNNKVTLLGKVVNKPVLSHEIFGEKFYECDLEVQRLSNYSDIIPITISERLINENFKEGNLIAVKGQFRSYNKQENEKSKLMLTVFVRELLPYTDKINSNVVELTGYICKEPVFRTTPFKREICDVLIAVNRSYNKSDYLPCIAWGRNAKFINECKVGDKVNLTGRIQSRVYQKKINDSDVVNKVAYEISLNKISLNKEVDIDMKNFSLNSQAQNQSLSA
jgi:single-stranded DNA-binding protein